MQFKSTFKRKLYCKFDADLEWPLKSQCLKTIKNELKKSIKEQCKTYARFNSLDNYFNFITTKSTLWSVSLLAISFTAVYLELHKHTHAL